MCGLESLLLALTLANDLVLPKGDPNQRVFSTNAICGCECAGTEAARLRCRADELDYESRRTKEYNEKLREFQAIVKMCVK